MNELNSIDSISSADAEMRSAIRRLTLVNFRNYRYVKVDIDKSFVVLSGKNGSGKTNVLEAISFLSQGRGFRNAKLSEIKTFDFLAVQEKLPDFINGSGWTVSAQVFRDGEEFTLGTSVESQIIETDYNESKEIERRIAQVNDQKLSSQNEFGNYLSLIWVVPQMDRLFTGGTQHRRHFLDRIVCAFDTDHARRLSSFDNLYRQWLQVLKNGGNTAWLTSLEEQLSGLGVSISAARCEQVDKLNQFMEKNPDDVFPDTVLELDGTIEKMLMKKAAVYVEDFYRESLLSMRRNILLNDANAGINKTDMKVVYKKKNIPANLCSTGEQKSLLLSIILSQARSLTSIKGYPPRLLLDEIATHLDDGKRDALLSKIGRLNTQTWLTTTNPSEFLNLGNKAQFFEIFDNGIHKT